ncbi:MAG: alanine racemase [Clostridiales bacterium]|nr:alanine racemase [Clostridiales bacterium]
MENYDRVYAAINLDAILYNLEQLKDNIAPETKIMGIIKADAYGHGAVRIGMEMEKLDYVFGYGVATAEEAFALRDAGLKKPILVLGYCFPYSYERLIKEEIRSAVFRYDTLEELDACAATLGKKAKIHIKVDTGMGRIGVMPDYEGLNFVRKALLYEHLEVEGVFTHFARADEKDKESAKKQLGRISSFMRRIENELGYNIPLKHCSNSAGIIGLKEANMDMVRAGIVLYGLSPSAEVSKDAINLKPALSLKSHIVYIKQVEKGVQISYGGTYTTDKRMCIATVPVGYGDGYPRSLSNKGYVLIRGRLAPIIGRVCMDQFMVCVDNIPDAAIGDEVTLIGEDKGASITMEEVSAISGRFNYEFACCLSERIPKVYIKDGKIIK